MDRIEVVAVLRELAGAALRLAELLAVSGEAAAEEAGAAPGARWRSPTRDLEPVVVRGEEDLAAALGRGHASLVTPGDGGLVPVEVSVEQEVRLLAVALAGDVALEAAHAGLGASGTAVDAMLAKGLRVLSAKAAAAGVAVPRDLFVAAASRFPELDQRGAEWR